ncbi:MAG: iron-sulfur cluster assembly accessory [Gallionellaceae bacterium]|nr:MAG: iron-sulfur cluster assembly accessory [Gallionellaceae bacterium]
MITLTPNAISAVDKFIKGSATPVAGLRIAISGGGCSGFQYGMTLEWAGNQQKQSFNCIDPTSVHRS